MTTDNNTKLSAPLAASSVKGLAGFTLIELLVVIAIIAILAGLLLTATGGASVDKMRSRIKTQLNEITTVIDEYHSNKGFYPPSLTNATHRPTLYYELVGTVFEGGSYRTLDGKERVSFNDAQTYFGAGFNGFVNSGKKADDARNFYPALRADSYDEPEDIPPGSDIELLSVPVKTDSGKVLTWNYNSKTPTNNVGRYDLWVEWTLKGKTEIIGNW